MPRLQRFKYVYARIFALILFVCAPLLAFNTASAACITNQQTCSSSYGVNEAFFGTGGALCDPSTPAKSEHSSGTTGYCAKVAIGETGTGRTVGTNFQAQAGFNTDRYPSLTFVVNNPNANLGYLSTGSAATTNATFSIITYLASGYIIQAYGSATSNGPSPHVLTPITTVGGGSSSPGTEQFGMNLVANTIPVSFGANAACQTAGFCTLGTVTSNYGTANKYYYTSGDTIITASKSTGQTNYTASYIFNIAPGTPAGTYTLKQALVATSTF